MEILSSKLTSLGSMSFDIKFKGMRKSESFIVYPVNEKTDKVFFQSSHRWAELNVKRKEFEVSASRHQYANRVWMQVCRMNKNTKIECPTNEQFDFIITEIAKSAGMNVGKNIKCDNSFADKL